MNKELRLCVEKAISKKGNEYVALVCYRGNTRVVVSFDKEVILQVADLTYGSLNSLEVGKGIEL